MGSVASSYLAPEFRATKGLAYLGGFFAYGLALSALYAGAGIGLPCPFRWLTGWECPLCGATRMGSALLHLDLASALAFNPVVLLGLAVLTVLGILWTAEVLTGAAVRPPDPLRDRLRRVHPTRWLVAALLLAGVYTVLRNLF